MCRVRYAAEAWVKDSKYVLNSMLVSGKIYVVLEALRQLVIFFFNSLVLSSNSRMCFRAPGFDLSSSM